MKRYIAALYASGKLVTGANHGEAFAKLSVDEQNSDLDSGFLDPETGRFFTEEYDLYLKQIYLIRHGEAHGQHSESYLTDLGVVQARRTAEFLDQFDLCEFEAFTSPFRRCLQTAEIISETTGLRFSVNPQLREKIDEDEFVNSYSLDYPQFRWPAEAGWKCPGENASEFLQRIGNVLQQLPAKSLITTHCDFIFNFVLTALGDQVVTQENWPSAIPGGSVTLIDAQRLVYMGQETSLSEC